MTEIKIKKDIPMEAFGVFNQTKFKVAVAKLEVGNEYETFKKLYKLEEKKDQMQKA